MASSGDDFEVPWVEKYRPNKLDDVSERTSDTYIYTYQQGLGVIGSSCSVGAEKTRCISPRRLSCAFCR